MKVLVLLALLGAPHIAAAGEKIHFNVWQDGSYISERGNKDVYFSLRLLTLICDII